MTGIIKVDTIQNNGGTTGLTIDSNGVVTQKNRPFFHATLDQSSTQNSGGTILPFGTVVEDTESAFNATTYKYTVPIAGLWMLKMGVRINNNSNAGTYTRMSIHLNGQTPNLFKIMDPIAQSQGTGYQHFTQDFVLRCAVNDVLDIRNHGATNFQSQQDESHFQGLYMGE